MKSKSPTLLIDLGSSSVKLYKFVEGKLSPLGSRTIQFKNNFDPEKGIDITNRRELIEFVQQNIIGYSNVQTHLYATALFRKLSPAALATFKDSLETDLALTFHLVSHEQESEYLEHALFDRFPTSDPVLFVNVGGGSTELVVVQNGNTLERFNVDVGVGTILTEYPQINDFPVPYSLDTMIKTVYDRLQPLKTKVSVAFVTGGELTWMSVHGYPVEDNTLFSDPDHPKIIDVAKYMAHSKMIYDSKSLEQLQEKMPENPGWMVGAKAYNVISDAVCTKYGLNTLIPSDSNLVHGIVRRDFSM